MQQCFCTDSSSPEAVSTLLRTKESFRVEQETTRTFEECGGTLEWMEIDR